MKTHDEHDKHLIEFGRATVETKGGPMGYEDSERTLWLHLGLARD
jgi:hypothetical protein